MASVQDHLGSDAIPRLRFGIGRPAPGGDPIAYVLEPFAPSEEVALGPLLDRAADAVEVVLQDGVEAAMNRFNASADETGAAGGLR